MIIRQLPMIRLLTSYQTGFEYTVDFVLFAVIAVILLAALVFGLHRYQLSETQYNADKTSPLPPLGGQDLTHFRAPRDASPIEYPSAPNRSETASAPPAQQPQIMQDTLQAPQEKDRTPPVMLAESDSGQALPENVEPLTPHSDPAPDKERISTRSGSEAADRDSNPTHGSAPTLERTAIPRRERVESSPPGESSDKPDTITAPQQSVDGEAPVARQAAGATEAGDTPENWSERVAELKKADCLGEALEICRLAFPLLSAYQQATLIHRARIKKLSAGDTNFEDELSALYRTAAQASFLHDRVRGLPHLTLSQLKGADLTVMDELELSYNTIGYSELRLIKKTDIKLLVDHWGEPASHALPRAVHAAVWEHLARQQQSTLF
jgi:hypothetical protein